MCVDSVIQQLKLYKNNKFPIASNTETYKFSGNARIKT